MAGELIPKLDEFERQELAIVNDTDPAINEKLDWSKKNAKTKYDPIKERIEKHHKFFNGDQIEYQLPRYKSKAVFNRIMPGVINNVGVLTDASFEPQVHPLPAKAEKAKAENKEKADGLENALRCLYYDKHVEEKMTKALYLLNIEEDVVLVPKWNEEEDDVDFEVSPIRCWRFADGADSIESSPWAIRITDKDWNFFTQNYSDKLEEIKKTIKKESKGSIEAGKFEIEEYFTDEVYIMRIGKVVLEKKLNPNFEFMDEAQQKKRHEKMGLTEQQVPFTLIKNFFKRAKKPIISLSAYNLGELYSRSRMQQQLKPQVDLNKRMQQIDDNLVLGASGIWIYDTLLISKKEMDKVSFAPFQKIGVPGGKQSLHRESGAGLPTGMADSVMYLQRMYDDVAGTHDVSRGQKVRTSTFGEANLLKESDETSIRLMSRVYQSGLGKLLIYWTQLMSLFYTIEHHFQWTDEMGAEQYVALTNKDITPGMHISVKVGAQLSKDKAQKQEEIAMLAQAGRVDPLTLFETLGYDSPLKLAHRLANWMGRQVISDEPMGAQGGSQGNEEVLKQQAALAAQENEAMAQGQPVPINEDDVHQVHLEVHGSYDGAVELHQAHMAEHEAAMQGQGGGVPAGGLPGGGAVSTGGAGPEM